MDEINLSEKHDKFNRFLQENKFNILYRGINKEKALKDLGLEGSNIEINKFAERLFYFGNKPHCIYLKKTDDLFEIDDVSIDFFKSLFKDLQHYFNNAKNILVSYFEINKITINYFKDDSNEGDFISIIETLDMQFKLNVKIHYWQVLHQLDAPNFKMKSGLVSSSSSMEEADYFTYGDKSQNDGLRLTFWTNIGYKSLNSSNVNLKLFKEMPYSHELETSIFGAIFPHYILSFSYENKLYFNPAFDLITNWDEDSMAFLAFSGFDINQEDFKNRLINEVGLTKYIVKIDDKITQENP